MISLRMRRDEDQSKILIICFARKLLLSFRACSPFRVSDTTRLGF